MRKSVIFLFSAFVLSGGSPAAFPQEASPFKYGSGVAVNDNVILTNRHVLQGCSYVTAQNDSQGGLKSSNMVVSTDPTLDLGYIQFPSGTFSSQVAIDDSSNLSLGEGIYTLGYPSGPMMGTSVRYSAGSVSELTNGIEFLHTANIDEGSSGSGAFDASSHALIGINTTLYHNNTSYGGAIKAAGAVFWLKMVNVSISPYNQWSSFKPSQDSNVKASFMISCYALAQQPAAPSQGSAPAPDGKDVTLTFICRTVSVYGKASHKWYNLPPEKQNNILYTLFEKGTDGTTAYLTTNSQKDGREAHYVLQDQGSGQRGTDSQGWPYYWFPVVGDAKLRSVAFAFPVKSVPQYYKGQFIGNLSWFKEEYDRNIYLSSCAASVSR